MIPPLGKTVRRIYRHAELYQAGEGWQLCLDGKPLKTPARRLLVIPGRVLAEAAVLEWNAQSERVDPLSMPVNRLANTALDRVAPSRAEVAATAAAYGATKAALNNMTEALKFDLEPKGIKVQLVCPGFVRTPLTDKNPFPMPFLMEPEEAADAFHRGLQGTSFEINFPKSFTTIMKQVRKLPHGLYMKAIRRGTGF